MQKKEINTIHDDEMIDLLKEINAYEDYKNNTLKCCFCESILNDNNLYAILPQKDEVKFCCNKKDCIQKIKINN